LAEFERRINLKKNSFLIYLLWGVLGFKGEVYAQSLAKTIPMSAVAQILRPNDSQGIALGLTGVSYREGLASTCSNPAGLKLDKATISFSHIPATERYGDMNLNQEAFGVGLPLNRNLMVGFQFWNLNFGKITSYDVHGNRQENERAGIREMQISGSGLLFTSRGEFSLGLTIKYLNFYVLDFDSKSPLVDTGLRYSANHERVWYSFGVAISNLGNELKHDGFTLERPIQLLRSGIAVGRVAKSDSSFGLLCTIEYQRSVNHDEGHAEWNHMGMGLELQFSGFLFGRIGYNFDFANLEDDAKIKGLTYGIGFNTPKKIRVVFPIGVSLNYGRGITDFRKLDANVISITLGF